MTKIELAKIKILTKIIEKLEPSEAEYAKYETEIRQSKYNSLGYNSALGFVVISRALTKIIDFFIVFMLRVILVIVAISIITMSYG